MQACSEHALAGCHDLERELRPRRCVRSQHDLRRSEDCLERLGSGCRGTLVPLDRVRGVWLHCHVDFDFLAAGDLERVGARIAGRGLAVELDVSLAVAVVVVGGHANLLDSGMHVGLGVIAIAGLARRAGREAHRGVAVAVLVVVATLVDLTVAVVVHTVADLGRILVDGRDRVVAIACLARRAGREAHRGVAVSVLVVVAAFVGCAVAVVVLPVADLRDRLREVDAGRTLGREAVLRAGVVGADDLADTHSVRAGLPEREDLVGCSVAVVVEAIATFRRGWIDRLLCVVAVACLARSAIDEAHRCIAEAVLVVVAALVGLPVAVIVQAVAAFFDVLARLGASDALLVVAANHDAVLALVGIVAIACLPERREILVDLAVAVVVDAVAELGDVGLALVGADGCEAVCCALERAVLALVCVSAVAGLSDREYLVGRSIAVVVDAVADLGRCLGLVRDRRALARVVGADVVAFPSTRCAFGSLACLVEPGTLALLV